jgi:hypothetical protein
MVDGFWRAWFGRRIVDRLVVQKALTFMLEVAVPHFNASMNSFNRFHRTAVHILLNGLSFLGIYIGDQWHYLLEVVWL